MTQYGHFSLSIYHLGFEKVGRDYIEKFKMLVFSSNFLVSNL
jgi:hypothetical protein